MTDVQSMVDVEMAWAARNALEDRMNAERLSIYENLKVLRRNENPIASRVEFNPNAKLPRAVVIFQMGASK